MARKSRLPLLLSSADGLAFEKNPNIFGPTPFLCIAKKDGKLLLQEKDKNAALQHHSSVLQIPFFLEGTWTS